MMPVFVIFLGLFSISMGLLAKKYPRIVLPVVFKLPETEPGKVALKGYTRVFRYCCCSFGVVVIAGYFLFLRLGWGDHFVLFSGVMIILIGSVLIIMRRKYRLPEGHKLLGGRLAGIVFLLVFFSVMIYAAYPAKISADAERLVISGSYGLTIPFEEIDSVKLIGTKPLIWEQANGVGVGAYSRGYYESEMGAVMQFVSSRKGPFLVVYSQNQKPIIINRRNAAETERLYATLSSCVNF